MRYLLIVLILSFEVARGHGGGLIKTGSNAGCHAKKSDGSFHCHRKGKPKITNAQDTLRYDRDAYGGWLDTDGDCQNSRAEILIKRSLIDVSFKGKRTCVVKGGKWDDFYYDDVLTNASVIDIDHVVPLKHAHENGAKYWNQDKKKQFSNDPENLVITHKSHNRSKSAKTPLLWSPINRSYACKYIKRWIKIKHKYDLDIDPNVFEYREEVCL